MKRAPLKNEFRWSVSRQACFDECQKKYWYTYYGSWDGWPVNAFDPNRKVDPLAALLYRLKQIQSLPLFIGSVVHETIEEALKKHHKQLPSAEVLRLDARKRFLKGIEESKEKKWLDHPKKFSNLFEWYYNTNLPTEEAIATYIERIEQMIASWRNSPAINQVIIDAKARWSGIEQNIEFLVDSVPVIVVIDFMLFWPNSEGDILIIFDWKTGGERKENIEQLYAYAMAAQIKLHQPIDKVVITPFYLAQGVTGYKKIGFKQTETLDLKIVEEVQNKIRKEGSKLLAIHKESSQDPLLFPYTENREKCLSCPFVEVCKKANYEPLTREELTSLILVNKETRKEKAESLL